jgi:hypothetical protein
LCTTAGVGVAGIAERLVDVVSTITATDDDRNHTWGRWCVAASDSIAE